jgi:hypothetical protein
MPNWVYNHIEVNNERAIDFMRSDERDFDFEKIIPMPTEEKDNWYDWRWDNWDTKWNASEVEVDGTSVTFETAWSAPVEVTAALAHRFPQQLIRHIWYDEDLGSNFGEEIYNQGVLQHRRYVDSVFSCLNQEEVDAVRIGYAQIEAEAECELAYATDAEIVLPTSA